jgi:sugar phosphate isomerase/epimerase
MKLSVAIAAKDALPSAFVVWRGFDESIPKAAEYGYAGVELALRSAEDVNPAALNKLLNKHSIEVSCISTGQVFAALGLYFTHPDPDIRNRVVRVFEGLIRLAGEFGGLVNIGRVRGLLAEGQSRAEAERLFLETADQIGQIAQRHEVSLLIEPVNRYELNFINNLDEGAALIGKLRCKNFGLMPDVFHMNIEDDRIGGSLIRHARLVRYIHLADSNRLAPGRGHMDFDEVFQALKASGFDGWAAIEILPLPDPDTAAAEAAAFILPKVRQYNNGAAGRELHSNLELTQESAP